MFATALSILLTLLGALTLRMEAQLVNPGSAALQQFQDHIDAYLKLRKAAAAEVPKLKPTESAENLAENKRLLAENIRRARTGATQGTVFSREITTEFRRLAQIAMQGENAPRVHRSLLRAEPVLVPLRVNDAYPAAVPLQSMPPTLLLNLPRLPMELEYRLIGKTLALRDVDANLIIDFIPGAIP